MNTKLSLTTVLLAAGVALSAGSANANSYNIGTLSNSSKNVVHDMEVSDSFIDTFTFNLGSQHHIQATLSELLDSSFSSALKLDSLDLDLYKKVSGHWNLVNDNPAVSGTGRLGLSFTSALMDQGTYRLNVNGMVSGDYGGYNLQIAAVPEPSEYGMLLVGLGIVSMVVRRQRKK